MNMNELFTQPEEFFEEVADFGRTSRALSVLAGVAVAFSLQGLVLIPLLGDRVGSFSAGVMGSVFATFFQPWIVWVLFVVSIWVMGTVLGGRPSVSHLVKTTAWALAPLAATGVAWAGARFLALQGAPLPQDPSYPGFIGETRALQNEYFVHIGGDPLYLVLRIVGIAFVFVSFYLMVYATMAGSNMDRRTAAIAVAPGALFYFASALGLLGFGL